jgi:hypothetical protein
MQLALIRPNTDIELFKIYSESLSLGYLSAVLRENEIETDLVDAYLENISVEDLTKKIFKKNYKIIGFSIYNATSLSWVSKATKLIT